MIVWSEGSAPHDADADAYVGVMTVKPTTTWCNDGNMMAMITCKMSETTTAMISRELGMTLGIS